jgi:hypothetical protein
MYCDGRRFTNLPLFVLKFPSFWCWGVGRSATTECTNQFQIISTLMTWQISGLVQISSINAFHFLITPSVFTLLKTYNTVMRVTSKDSNNVRLHAHEQRTVNHTQHLHWIHTTHWVHSTHRVHSTH